MPKQIQYNPELVYNALSAYALGVKKGTIAEKLNITRYHLNKMLKDFEGLDSEKFKMLCAMSRRDQFREKKVKQPKKSAKQKQPVGYKQVKEDPLFSDNPFAHLQEEEKPKKKQPAKKGKKKLLEMIQEDETDELPEDQYEVPVLKRQNAHVAGMEDEYNEDEDTEEIEDVDEIDLEQLIEEF